MMVGSPGVAITWQLWTRVRLTVLILTGCLALLGSAAHLPGAMGWRNTVFLLSSFVAGGLVFWLGAYALPGKDVLARHSGYPDWMLVLPVRTKELVFWPMAHACGAAVLSWLVPTQLILRPLGVEPPLLWPGVMIAALIAWIQALLWIPCGIPYGRLFLVLTLLPAMIITGVCRALEGTPPVQLAIGFSVAIAAAFGVAVAGLGAARRGDEPSWSWCPPAALRLRRLPGTAVFPSPHSAQFWYEWRSSGLALPLSVATLGVLCTLPFLWVHDLSQIGMRMPWSGFGSIELNLWLRMLTAFLFLPPLLAAILGCGRRRYATSPGDLTLHPFLGTRPVAPGLFVSAKLRTAALSTALTWGITLLFYSGWLLFPGRSGDSFAPALILLLRHGNEHTALLFALILAMLIFWTWKNQVQGLFADLGGRRWLASGAPALLHSLVFLGYMAWLNWCGQAQDVDLHFVPIPPHWPWLLGLVLLAKVILAIAALRELARCTPLAASRIALWIGAWSTTVAVLGAALHWIAHTGRHAGELAEFLILSYLPWCAGEAPDGLMSWGYLLALSALFVPLTRLVLAPLALQWNRHR